MSERPDFLLVKEAADILRRDEATVRRMIRRGDLEAYKPGGNVYLIPAESVQALLERSRVEPEPPPARQPAAYPSVPPPRPRPAGPRKSFRERAKEARAAQKRAPGR